MYARKERFRGCVLNIWEHHTSATHHQLVGLQLHAYNPLLSRDNQ